ncbi:hypothetical protein DFQ28_005523 [Apophysomyces sp. BC1034]|nr:hypothetical protein DFQ30_006951 [Apophysomyces sp. BC1015]KAG0177682.1 hypothetical protein DFQ29_004537 [Apophysomyces sp. BC1021]KAG0187989.1 hypothetical protein DFQ28_005523 [Apophysomyces sp. BC1034]
MSTLYSVFNNQANKENLAIIIPQSAPNPTSLTYSQLLTAIHDFCDRLTQILPAEALKAGNAISLAYPNSLEFVIAFLGTGFMRLISSPLNPSYTMDEFNFYLEDAKSSVMIVPPNSASNPAVMAARQQGAIVVEIQWNGRSLDMNVQPPQAASLTTPSPDPRPRIVLNPRRDDIALLLHTSGTTGRPKGVPLTHLNLATSMRNIVRTYELSPKDRTMLVMPLFHVHGLVCGLLSTLLSGGTAVIPTKFSASQFWQDFSAAGCNWYTAVPTIHQILLRSPPDQVPSIRFIRSCSSSLAPSTFHALEKHFRAPVLEAYAMTEAAHQMTSNPLPHRGAHKPGSVGYGHGVEVMILDDAGREVEEGEVCIRGDNVTKGYLNNPEATAKSFTADGYFRTGDQGKKDRDGYVVLTGRIKELINRGGEKISPIELDAVLLSHPSVAEAVSFAVPDAMYGQEVHAAVVLRKSAAGTHRGIERELQAFLQTKVAKFKVPKRIYVTEQMPKTATGKIQRRVVSQTFFEPPQSQAKL